MDAPPQPTGPNNQAQQSETVPPVTNPELPKKGRRKLNRAIFDIDAAAALRIKAQTGPPTIETKNHPLPGPTIQQATDAAHLLDPLLKGPSEGTLVERTPDSENLAEEQPQAQSKDVSFRDRRRIVSQLIRIGTHQIAVADSSPPRVEDSQLPEVCVATFVV